jgi:hypothetical protein
MPLVAANATHRSFRSRRQDDGALRLAGWPELAVDGLEANFITQSEP